MFVNFVSDKLEIMIQTTQLILTRHGETVENRQGIMQGHMPGTLSPLGIQQAKDLAATLKEEKIDAIVCSDLARSYDTAKIVGDNRGLVPRPVSLLREIDWGKYAGGRLAAIDWAHLPEGCETLENLMERAGKFIAWVCEEYPGKRVLAVGHGAIDRAILACWEGKTAREMAEMPIMQNTSFIRLNLKIGYDTRTWG